MEILFAPKKNKNTWKKKENKEKNLFKWFESSDTRLKFSALCSHLFRIAKVKIRVRPVWVLLAVRELESRRQIEGEIVPDALRADRAIPRRSDHYRLYIPTPSGIVAIATAATAAAADSTADRTGGRVIFRRCTASAAADLHSLAHRQHLQNRRACLYAFEKKRQRIYLYTERKNLPSFHKYSFE